MLLHKKSLLLQESNNRDFFVMSIFFSCEGYSLQFRHLIP